MRSLCEGCAGLVYCAMQNDAVVALNDGNRHEKSRTE